MSKELFLLVNIHSHARSEHSCMLGAQPLLFLTLCWACYPPPSLILLTTGRVNMPTWWNIFMGQKPTSCGHKAQFLSIMTQKPMALSQCFGAENPSPPEILGAGFSPSMYIAHHFLAFGFCLAFAWGFSRSLLFSFSFSFLKGTSNKGGNFFSGQTFQSKRMLCQWCTTHHSKFLATKFPQLLLQLLQPRHRHLAAATPESKSPKGPRDVKKKTYRPVSPSRIKQIWEILPFSWCSCKQLQ